MNHIILTSLLILGFGAFGTIFWFSLKFFYKLKENKRKKKELELNKFEKEDIVYKNNEIKKGE